SHFSVKKENDFFRHQPRQTSRTRSPDVSPENFRSRLGGEVHPLLRSRRPKRKQDLHLRLPRPLPLRHRNQMPKNPEPSVKPLLGPEIALRKIGARDFGEEERGDPTTGKNSATKTETVQTGEGKNIGRKETPGEYQKNATGG